MKDKLFKPFLLLAGLLGGGWFILSLSLHMLILGALALQPRETPKPAKHAPISVKIIHQPALKKPDRATPQPDQQEIVETPQQPTQEPIHADFLSAQDHQAIKEQQTKKNTLPMKGDPSKKAGIQSKAPQKPAPVAEKPDLQKPVAKDLRKGKKDKKPEKLADKTLDRSKTNENLPKLAIESNDSKYKIPTAAKARNGYEALLNSQMKNLANEVDAGYQSYVDRSLQEGDVIDINTQEYRYLGYFTNLRKAIELTWVYPRQAVNRGLTGKVTVQFVIAQDGKLAKAVVMDSSGQEVLDYAILDAIKLAAPFAPLPNGFAKDRLSIVGTFTYRLVDW